MIRVIIVNAQDLVRAGIKRLLADQSDIEVIAEAHNGETALRVAREHLPDVVVLDVDICGMGGIEATRRLLRVDPDMRIIGLGVHPAGPMASRLLEIGALGYLTKDCTETELAQAIRNVHRGQLQVGEQTARAMIQYTLSGEATPVDTLTPRELSVMRMLGQGKRRVEISHRLCISPKTVSTYRARLMKKLGAKSDVDLAHLSLSYGLIEPRQRAC